MAMATQRLQLAQVLTNPAFFQFLNLLFFEFNFIFCVGWLVLDTAEKMRTKKGKLDFGLVRVVSLNTK